ncbi:sensor histidine kinase [Paenibacillus sp. TH7-28]
MSNRTDKPLLKANSIELYIIKLRKLSWKISFKRSWQRWSLPQKLLFFYLPLFVLPSMIGLGLLANNYNAAIRENAEAYSDTIVSLTVDKLDAAIENYNNLSLRILTVSQITTILSGSVDNEFEQIEIQRSLEKYVLPITGGFHDDGILGLVFITNQGTYTLGKDFGQPLDPRELSEITKENGQPYWAPLKSDSQGGAKGNGFRLGRVLKNDNFKPIGIFYLVISPTSFQDILNSAMAGPNTTFKLVDRQTLLAEEPAEPTELVTESLQSEKWLAHNEWKLVANLPLTTLYATVYRLSMIAAWLAGGCFIVGVIAFYLIRMDVALPIAKLHKNMRKGLKGEHPNKLSKFKGAKEIAELNDTFISIMYEIYNLIEEVKKSEKRKREAQHKVLRNQLSPHFLYNTLNSIRWMAMIRKQDHIREVVDALSNLLQYTIRDADELVTLNKEVSIMQEFVKIQQVRYHNFAFFAHLEPGIGEHRLLKFLLQPLLENAIVHGLSSIDHAGEIRLEARVQGHMLLLSIHDNGNGISKERLIQIREDLSLGNNNKHIGLSNVKEMIDIHYGPPFGLEMTSNIGYGTTVTLKLPVLKEGGNDTDAQARDRGR